MTTPLLMAEIEGMVLGSRTLSFGAKKNLLATMGELGHGALEELKRLFEEEIEEFKKIDELERKTWREFGEQLQNLLHKYKTPYDAAA